MVVQTVNLIHLLFRMIFYQSIKIKRMYTDILIKIQLALQHQPFFFGNTEFGVDY